MISKIRKQLGRYLSCSANSQSILFRRSDLWVDTLRGSMGLVLAVSGAVVASPETASADNPVNVQDYLRRFHENPAAVLADRLVKLDASGNPVPNTPVVSSDLRKSTRARLVQAASAGGQRSRMPSSENPAELLRGMTVEKHLAEMEQLGWMSATLAKTPWSGSYWPTQRGGLGFRYADYESAFNTFPDNYAYYQSHPSASTAVEMLSPSEKYDLLLGDTTFALTEANWQKGVRVVKHQPDVPGWFGICHGWAPASYLEDEPVRAVTVTTKDARSITFYPGDIKALASALWAETSPPVVFLGRKCVKDHPAEDELGRITDSECFDSNPATWHLATVNRLASGKTSFIMDAQFDSEVWNQPVASYKYNYFNPQTFESADHLDAALMPIEQFTVDKFKKYRSAQTKFVVGISFDVTYSSENEPYPADEREQNYMRTVRYIYDLELDANREIIGGEWYSNAHPDFIWAPVLGYAATSFGEKKLQVSTRWTGTGPVPDDLLNAAKLSSPYAQPVAGVVKALLDLAK